MTLSHYHALVLLAAVIAGVSIASMIACALMLKRCRTGMRDVRTEFERQRTEADRDPAEPHREDALTIAGPATLRAQSRTVAGTGPINDGA